MGVLRIREVRANMLTTDPMDPFQTCELHSDLTHISLTEDTYSTLKDTNHLHKRSPTKKEEGGKEENRTALPDVVASTAPSHADDVSYIAIQFVNILG